MKQIYVFKGIESGAQKLDMSCVGLFKVVFF